jgi:uncharacterized protein (DUF697 family)
MAAYTETLNRILKGVLDDASVEEKDRAADEMIRLCSVAAAAAAAQPVPLLDLVLITPIHLALVQAMARIHGYSLDARAARELLGTLGASLVSQRLAVSALKLFPLMGLLAAASMAYALTQAIGEVSRHYFANGRKLDAKALRARFDRTYRARRAARAKRRGDDAQAARDLEAKLEDLRRRRDRGEIDEATFQREKEALLASF